MCGIVGYIGEKETLPIILGGLKSLEYRGYDSAGVALSGGGKTFYLKRAGGTDKLIKDVSGKKTPNGIGIGHTRWATHGEPTETNAHPHHDCEEKIFLVHNGIIENHEELRTYLKKRGHTFRSETDTEVAVHLIEDFLKKNDGDFKDALFKTLKMIEGAYALVLFDSRDPKRLYAARLSSPLVIGVGNGENFLASDASALVNLTKNVVYLKDGEVAEITDENIAITNLNQQPTPVEVEKLEWDMEQAQKGNFPHFMLKEIFEGSEAVESAFRGRLKPEEGLIRLGGLEAVQGRLKKIKRLLILACGTSYYAGMIGEYMLEEVAKLPTEVHFASEFRYRNEPLNKDTAVLAISQSGETADTLAALKKAREAGLLTLGLVNVVGSSIARETDAGVYNHAGPEIGVASTKAFLSQLTILALITLHMTKDNSETRIKLMEELARIPAKIEKILADAEKLKQLAERYKKYKDFLFMGRRYNYPVALEGALKLKEVSYIHAEGYGAGEMKHGPIAMIGSDFPTFAIVPQNSVSEKMYSNIEEIKTRKGPILAIATEGDKKIANLADDVFYIPSTLEPLEPFLAVVPLQLFAYYVGTALGRNVDKPRNLAKSVTVE